MVIHSAASVNVVAMDTCVAFQGSEQLDGARFVAGTAQVDAPSVAHLTACQVGIETRPSASGKVENEANDIKRQRLSASGQER